MCRCQAAGVVVAAWGKALYWASKGAHNCPLDGTIGANGMNCSGVHLALMGMGPRRELNQVDF